MELQQELPINTDEIWDYLQKLPVDELVSYDLQIEALFERVQRDVIRFIPANRLAQFKQRFINKHFSAEERQLHPGENLFHKALMLELRDTVILAKNMLFDIIFKHDIFLGDNIPARFRADEINQAYYTAMHQQNDVFIMSAVETDHIMKHLRDSNPNFSFYTRGENGKANRRLAIAPENIQFILDQIGYELNPKHPKFGHIFKKFNNLRLSLNEVDHLRIFGKAKNDDGPFTLVRAHAPELLHRPQKVLTHEQTRLIWYSLSDLQRRELFLSQEEPTADQPIVLKPGISHLRLLNAAAENYHNIKINKHQAKRLLSQLTLAQLCEMDKISYHKAADAGRSALTSGSQYLGTYSVNTSNIARVLQIVMGAAFKLSIYATAITSLIVGSLILGVAAAIIQYHQNTEREERFRLSHIAYSLAINSKRRETLNTLASLTNAGLTLANNGASRYEQLIKMIENAGLTHILQSCIQTSQKSGPIKHAITQTDIQLNHLYQLNTLTQLLQLNRQKIANHYDQVDTIRRDTSLVSERMRLTRQMKQTDNLLRFTDATLTAIPLPAQPDNQALLPTAEDNTLGTRRRVSLQRSWNNTKRYFRSKQTTLRPLANGLAATILVSLSLIGAVLLLATGAGTIIGLGIAAIAIGVVLGVASYKTVQRVQMMEQVQVANTEAMNQETQHADQINNFRIAASTLKQIESQEMAGYNTLSKSQKAKGKEEVSEKPAQVHVAENRALAENYQLKQENAQLRIQAIELKAKLAAQQRAESQTNTSPHRALSFMNTSHNVDLLQLEPVEQSPQLIIN